MTTLCYFGGAASAPSSSRGMIMLGPSSTRRCIVPVTRTPIYINITTYHPQPRSGHNGCRNRHLALVIISFPSGVLKGKVNYNYLYYIPGIPVPDTLRGHAVCSVKYFCHRCVPRVYTALKPAGHASFESVT